MKLFLSIPTQAHKLANGDIEPSYVTAIEGLAAQLREAGHEVFCVVERTHWNEYRVQTPEDQFNVGLQALERSDKSIVFLDGPISPGVEIELGYAYAKSIPIEMYQIGEPAWSNMALGQLSKAMTYYVADVDDFVKNALANNSPL